MKDKNGFVFVETMVVVVALVTLLILLYSSYSGIISLERRRARYDDPAFIYKTYTISKFLISLKDDANNSIIKNKMNEMNSKQNQFILISTDDEDLFNEEYNSGANTRRKNYFSQLYNLLHVQSITLINERQINYIKSNQKESLVSTDLYNYLISIPLTGNLNQYYFIIMYAEKVNGNECDPNQLINGSSSTKTEQSCTFYYANLKIDEELGD